MIKNIRVVFAYDGSKYSGMQSQGINNSIQEEIENAIFKITGCKSRLITAGRTDAGVHAYSQVANFLTPSNIPGHAYKYHFQKFLSQNIIIIQSDEVSLNFHSRFNAISKTYRYFIYNDDFMHPSFNSTYEHVTYKLDITRMRKAANYLIGKHDFKAFTKYENKEVNSIRNIERINIDREDKLIILEFQAESFLYNQIRIMVGTLIDIGRGHREAEYILELLESKDRLKAGKTYGPNGLYLMKIDY